jgi:hypothetical protein
MDWFEVCSVRTTSVRPTKIIPASILGLLLHSRGDAIRDQETSTESLDHLEFTVDRGVEERVDKECGSYFSMQ